MTYPKRQKITYTLFALPALLFLAFQLVPLWVAARSAFVDAAGRVTDAHVIRVWADPLFRTALRNNVLIPIASVAFETLIGVAMALWFNTLHRGKTFWRTIAIVPFAVPEIVYLLTMKLLFRDHGYFNSLLFSAMGLHPVHWFQPGSVLLPFMIIVIDAWRVTPLIFLIVLVALEQLPESFVDAARVDGASFGQIARFIQIPLIIPALFIAVALRAVDAFQIFATPLILTGVEGFPVLTSVAYHYQMEASDPAAANVAALSLALFLFAALAGTFWLLKWRKRGKAAE